MKLSLLFCGIMICLAALFNQTSACTIIVSNDGKNVFAGNNEDFENDKKSQIWFYPASKKKSKRISLELYEDYKKNGIESTKAKLNLYKNDDKMKYSESEIVFITRLLVTEERFEDAAKLCIYLVDGQWVLDPDVKETFEYPTTKVMIKEVKEVSS